jgi:hypothetical protein
MLLLLGRGDKRQSFIIWVRHSHVRQVPDSNVFLHCKDTIPKIRNKYFQKRNCGASVPISTSCVCERLIYSHDQPDYSAAEKYVDRSCDYINRSQAHECGNWDCGRASPFLGKHKWDFLSSVAPQAKAASWLDTSKED